MDKREMKAMVETEARLLAQIEQRSVVFVAKTREHAEREYQAAVEFVRNGGERSASSAGPSGSTASR